MPMHWLACSLTVGSTLSAISRSFLHHFSGESDRRVCTRRTRFPSAAVRRAYWPFLRSRGYYPSAARPVWRRRTLKSLWSFVSRGQP